MLLRTIQPFLHLQTIKKQQIRVKEAHREMSNPLFCSKPTLLLLPSTHTVSIPAPKEMIYLSLPCKFQFM